MPKKNLLISAALTAFILVIATGITSAYRRVNTTLDTVQANPTAADQIQVVQQAEPAVVNPGAVENVPVVIDHQGASLIAANFLGQTDLYSVENVIWEGVEAYKVVFSTGDIVYVSMYGDILGTEAPATVFVTANTNNDNPPVNNNNHHDDDHNEGREEHDDD